MEDQVSQSFSRTINIIYPIVQELKLLSDGINDGTNKNAVEARKNFKDLFLKAYNEVLRFIEELKTYDDNFEKNQKGFEENKENNNMDKSTVTDQKQSHQGFPVNQLVEIEQLNTNIEQLIQLEKEIHEEATKLNEVLKECNLNNASEDIHGLTETFQEYVKDVKTDYRTLIEDLKKNRRDMERSTEKLRDESIDMIYREGKIQFIIYGLAIGTAVSLIVGILNLFF
ncbi:hypothetical protein [Eubacterium callanderi]|uniref:hypothetical protein n=1 Tax=Eubacterium callanderi TaxID=53442 RepID=UPI002670FF70|nr:hypothetical protein [Eubacterium callanderi]